MVDGGIANFAPPAGGGERRQERGIQLPLGFIDQRAKWITHDLERMDIRCTGCQALHWVSEPSGKRPHGGEASYHSCCKHGDAKLERMRQLPEPLHSLMTATDT